MTVTLIGMMGSGKSTVGKLIAEKMNYRFFDTDSLIVEKTGREINDIFRSDGEKYFRDLEKEIITELYSGNNSKNQVIATGGGVILSKKNRNILRNNSKVYWLNVKTEILADRLYENNDRPLIKKYKNKRTELINHLNNMLRNRFEYYQIGIEIDGNMEPLEIAKEIINHFRNEVDKIE